MWRAAFGFTIAVGAALAAVPASAAPRDPAAACYNGSGDSAITVCTRLIDSGEFKGAVLALLYVVRGNKLSRSERQRDLAISNFQQAILLDPKLAQAYHGLGNAYRAKGDINRAVAEYDKALAIDPKLAYVYAARGVAHFTNADTDRAIADFDQAIRLNASLTSVYLHRANAWRARGETDRAIADYGRAIRGNPKSVAAYNGRGHVYLQLRQFSQAIGDYSAALKIDRMQAQPLYGRGIARLQNGDAGGNADLDAAKAIDPAVVQEFAHLEVPAVPVNAPRPASLPAASAPAAPAPAASARAANCAAAEAHWISADQIRTIEVYLDHLARFPNCNFAVLATARIEALKK